MDLGTTPKASGLPHFHPGWHQKDKKKCLLERKQRAFQESRALPCKVCPALTPQQDKKAFRTVGRHALGARARQAWCWPSLCPSCPIKEAGKLCQAHMAARQSPKWGQLKHDLDASVTRTNAVRMGKAGRAASERLLGQKGRSGHKDTRSCQPSCRYSFSETLCALSSVLTLGKAVNLP